MNFRKILKQQPKGLIPVECKSKSSPQCKLVFVQTRHEQTMCVKCLDFNDLFSAHPLLDME